MHVRRNEELTPPLLPYTKLLRYEVFLRKINAQGSFLSAILFYLLVTYAYNFILSLSWPVTSTSLQHL